MSALHPDAEHAARMRELTDGLDGYAPAAPHVESALVSAEIATFLEDADDDTSELVTVERWRLKRWAELLEVRS